MHQAQRTKHLAPHFAPRTSAPTHFGRRMRAAWAYFESFPQAAADFARLARTKLPMPVLAIGGDQANGEALARQVALVATHASSIVLPDTGHCRCVVRKCAVRRCGAGCSVRGARCAAYLH